MSLLETGVEGTLQEVGTLVLDEKPNPPSGRGCVELPAGDPFWQRTQAMWAIPLSPSHDGCEAAVELVRQMREEEVLK